MWCWKWSIIFYLLTGYTEWTKSWIFWGLITVLSFYSRPQGLHLVTQNMRDSDMLFVFQCPVRNRSIKPESHDDLCICSIHQAIKGNDSPLYQLVYLFDLNKAIATYFQKTKHLIKEADNLKHRCHIVQYSLKRLCLMKSLENNFTGHFKQDSWD